MNTSNWNRIGRQVDQWVLSLAFLLAQGVALGQSTDLVGTDVGGPDTPGVYEVLTAGGKITGGGRGVVAAGDQFHLLHYQQEGDFDLAVRVTGVSDAEVWAKAGLMARESTNASSRFAAVFATPALPGCLFQSRAAEGGNASMVGHFPVNHPFTWLRLQRRGAVFSGFASLDGGSWYCLGTNTIGMTNVVELGLALTSSSTNALAAAEFRDFGPAQGAETPGWPVDLEDLGPTTRRTGLAISEIMYAPAPRADQRNLQYIEVFNSNPYFEDISGYRLSGAVDYLFPEGTVLRGGGFAVVAAAPHEVETAYGLSNVLGPWSGTLKTSGTVRLRSTAGAVLLEIPYQNQVPWPVAADGTGHSLALTRPSMGEANPLAWAASGELGGSPGRVNALVACPLDDVRVNEVFPAVTGGATPFVELYNHGTNQLSLAGCLVGNGPAVPGKPLAESAELKPGGHLVLSSADLGFDLPRSGGTIYLWSPGRRRVLEVLAYGATDGTSSWGRFPDGAERFGLLAQPSPDLPNSRFAASSVLINEIMYKPISGRDEETYVELHNPTQAAVDLAGWRFVDGIDFTFSAGTVLPAGGFLVVAKDVARLRTVYPQLPEQQVVGNFSGRLAGGGERLALAKPVVTGQPSAPLSYVVVEETTYGTGGRWGKWSDGGGSSLELVEARADRTMAANWADSNESGKAPWTTVETTGVLDNGNGTVDSLHVLLLEAGECLLDNVEVFVEGTSSNLVANSTFENGRTGWVPLGNQVQSHLCTTEGFESAQSLRVVATGRGDTGANRIRVPLTNYRVLTPGTRVTIRAKARWLGGFPELLLRLKGNYLEAFARLEVPAQPGTPGAANSAAQQNAGPAISRVRHWPVLPAAQQAVTVTARIDDPDGVGGATLFYRLDPATTYQSAGMNDEGHDGDAVAGDGIFSGLIPGQNTGVLAAFFIEAGDAGAVPATNRFPASAPARECLVRFGEPVAASSFFSYRLWLTAATVTTWRNRPVLSNEELDGTFVYGQNRTVYNAGGRFSGSPWHQDAYSSPTTGYVTYALSMPEDNRVLGASSFNKVHALGNTPGDDSTYQCEQAAYWMVRQMGLPWNYQRYIHMYVNGLRRGYVMEDTQVPAGDSLEEWFPDDADGQLYKINGWYEYANGTSGALSKTLASWATLNDYRTDGGAPKLARYRWNWAPRAVEGTANNFDDLLKLVAAGKAEGNEEFIEDVGALADLEQWMHTFAIEHAVGNWDSFGNRNAQNMYAYKPRNGPWKLLIWDFNIVLSNSGSDGPTGDDLFQFYYSDTFLRRLYNHPAAIRMYLRALKEIATGPMVKERVEPIINARYAALKASGGSVLQPTAIKNYLTSRRTYLLNYLTNFQFSFQLVSPGPDQTVAASNWVSLAGTAPLEMKTVTVNGIEYPVIWDSIISWRVSVPLHDRTNTLTVVGMDAANRPLQGALASTTIEYRGTLQQPEGLLVINEILTQPTTPGAEFVELYNRSPEMAFDLTGMRLRGLDFTFRTGAWIGPGEYLILTRDAAAFRSVYGDRPRVTGEFGGWLNSQGETLQLVRPDGQGGELVVDEVAFQVIPPWPVAGQGSGSSLQLAASEEDNGLARAWFSVTPEQVGARKWKRVVRTGIAGSDARLLVYHSPEQHPVDMADVVGEWTGAIQFNPDYEMTVAFERGLTGELSGTFIGADFSIPLDSVTFTNRPNIKFSFGANQVRFSGKLSDDGMRIAGTFSEDTQQGVISYPFYLSRNQDKSVVWGGDVYIDDVQLVAGSVAEAGPNLVHNGDFETPLTGPWNVSSNHAASVISTETRHAGNASLQLVASFGGGGVDTAVWQTTEPLIPGGTYTLSCWYLPTTNGVDLTVGMADGAIASVTSVLPERPATPGAPNSVRPDDFEVPALFLSEMQPVNVNGLMDSRGDRDPWVEVINLGNATLKLGDWSLAKDATDAAWWSFPDDATLAPGEVALVWLDGEIAEQNLAEWHAFFRPEPTAGTVFLGYSQGSVRRVVDALTYQGLPAGQSYGIVSGNPSQRRVYALPTPGQPNGSGAGGPQVLITEWMAANSGIVKDPADDHPEDWFELYNGSDRAVDLTGYLLTDDPAAPGKFVIPSGKVIPAYGYLVVWADEDTSQNDQGTQLHVNFKLAQSGESITLRAPDGTVMDTVSFGQQLQGVSQGRRANTADAALVLMQTPTPGALNDPPEPPGQVRLKGVRISEGGIVTLVWTAQTGKVYQLQALDVLGSSVWQPLGSPITATGNEVQYSDTAAATLAERFYRVLLEP